MSDKISGQVPGWVKPLLGPDLNLAEEIRLRVGWSRGVGPFFILSTPPPSIPHGGREMSFSNIYWKVVAIAVVRGQGRKEVEQGGSGAGLPLLSGNLRWKAPRLSPLARVG